MHPPKAFISYSREDEEHGAWVLDLATRLRGAGVEVTLDQWHLWPADELTRFMERGIQDNDFVLMICTPEYKRKFDLRADGVGYEASLITGQLLARRGEGKFIPVLRRGEWPDALPAYLAAWTYVDLRDGRPADGGYGLLLDLLWNRRRLDPGRGPEAGSGAAAVRPRSRSATPAERWLRGLARLRDEGQIGDADWREVLAGALGEPPGPAADDAEVARALAAASGAARRLFWGAHADALARRTLADGRAARRHQVLAALALGLDVVRTALGIRFVLVPPGATPDGLRNPAPFYLAQAPLSEAEWASVAEGAPGAASPDLARGNLSPADVARFVQAPGARLEDGVRLDVPLAREWRFAAALGAVPPLTPLPEPRLRTGSPSPIGLYALLGVIWQLCAREGTPARYEAWGGGHRTRLSGRDPPVQPCPTTLLRSSDWGFRPVLRLL